MIIQCYWCLKHNWKSSGSRQFTVEEFLMNTWFVNKFTLLKYFYFCQQGTQISSSKNKLFQTENPSQLYGGLCVTTFAVSPLRSINCLFKLSLFPPNRFCGHFSLLNPDIITVINTFFSGCFCISFPSQGPFH